MIIIEFGTCGSVIAVPSVVPLMGNSFTCGAASVPVLHAFGAGVPGDLQVTYAVAEVPGVPVTVPVTELLVTVVFVPMLQLFGTQEAEIPTTPGATPFTVPWPFTPAIASCEVFQVNAGSVVNVVPAVSFTTTVKARVLPVATVK